MEYTTYKVSTQYGVGEPFIRPVEVSGSTPEHAAIKRLDMLAPGNDEDVTAALSRDSDGTTFVMHVHPYVPVPAPRFTVERI